VALKTTLLTAATYMSNFENIQNLVYAFFQRHRGLKSFVHIAKRDGPKAIATFSALAIVSILKYLSDTSIRAYFNSNIAS
jgi:hypothetical protein